MSLAPDSAVTRALTLQPIGYVRAPLATKVEAARQPRAARGVGARIELSPGRNFEHALEELDAWDHIWVLFWFDRNQGWRPKVLPPRSRTGRKGVFATRSPHRPNPLGLSAVRLVRVDGLTLHVEDVDMLDGTPVLDIKPYVPYTDAIADASNGWLEHNSTRAPADPIHAFAVCWSDAATEQAEWIETRTGLPLRERATATLTLGPEPHPYRRIRRDTRGLTLAVKDWRVRFAVTGTDVAVASVSSGYRAAELARGVADAQLDVHREFRARWSGAS